MGVWGVFLCVYLCVGVFWDFFCRGILLAPWGVGVPSGWALSGQKVGGGSYPQAIHTHPCMGCTVGRGLVQYTHEQPHKLPFGSQLRGTDHHARRHRRYDDGWKRSTPRRGIRAGAR